MQAISDFRKTESKVERIEDAINFVNNRLSATNFLPMDSITLASQDQLTAGSILNRLARCHVQDAELNSSSDQNEMKIPSELISHCLATLLMIQVNHMTTEFSVRIFSHSTFPTMCS